jgi:hypothetical protein
MSEPNGMMKPLRAERWHSIAHILASLEVAGETGGGGMGVGVESMVGR